MGCQGRNGGECRSKVIDKSTLQNGVMYYVREGYYFTERGKRDVYYDKQIGKAVTALNCVLKGLWEEVGSGGIRKKLKVNT